MVGLLRFIFVLALSFCILLTKAQGYKVVEGKILAEDNSPVQYASIVLIPEMIGTVSNEEGIFELKIPENAENDSLMISCVGYKRICISVSKIVGKLNIQLIHSDITLQEVTIRPVNYRDLIRKAIGKIKNNYPNTPTLSETHLCYEVKQNQKYIIFFDGSLKIKIPDYSKYGKFFTSYLIDKRIYLKDKDMSRYYYGDYAGNILAELFLTNQDFIKNINKYDFYSKSLTTMNDDIAYEIDFKPLNKERPFSYTGKIYVDTTNLAILHLEYSLIENHKNRKLAYYLLDKKVDGSKYISEISRSNYKVNFIKGNNEKYYINFIDYDSDVNISCKEANISDKFQSKCRYIFIDHNYYDNQFVDLNEFSLFSFKLKNPDSFKNPHGTVLNRYINEMLDNKIEELKKEYPDIEFSE